MPACHRPAVVAFDVMGTLFPIEPLRETLVEVGLPPQALEILFARILRDGFALAASGTFRSFPVVAEEALRGLLAQHHRPEDEASIRLVFDRLSRLPSRPDAGSALARLLAAGVRTLALTNGTARNTQSLLEGAGLADRLERIVSIDEPAAWKPRMETYHHATKVAGVDPARMALVAAHAWDCHGAARAGFLTGWLGRPEMRFSESFDPPDVRGETLSEVVEALLALPADS